MLPLQHLLHRISILTVRPAGLRWIVQTCSASHVRLWLQNTALCRGRHLAAGGELHGQIDSHSSPGRAPAAPGPRQPSSQQLQLKELAEHWAGSALHSCQANDLKGSTEAVETGATLKGAPILQTYRHAVPPFSV